MENRFLQDTLHGCLQSSPLTIRQMFAGPLGVDACLVEHFGRVQIAHTGDSTLIEQGHLDVAAAGSEAPAKLRSGYGQGIGPQFVRSQFGQ